MLNRRNLLLSAGAGVLALALQNEKGEAQIMATTTTDQANINFRALSEDDWKKRLTEQQFYVLRKHGTERAGTSPLNKEKRKGIFACAGCDKPLFSSDTKFESGTGWPSFLQAAGGRSGNHHRPFVVHDAHRGALRALSWPSRPRIRRRPEADRPALLHERHGVEIHAGDARQRLIAKQSERASYARGRWRADPQRARLKRPPVDGFPRAVSKSLK